MGINRTKLHSRAQRLNNYHLLCVSVNTGYSGVLGAIRGGGVYKDQNTKMLQSGILCGVCAAVCRIMGHLTWSSGNDSILSFPENL